MFGNVVRGVPGERYEEILREARRRAGVREDRELSVAQLRELTQRFRALYEATPASRSRRTRGSSCGWRSAPSSTPGWAIAPSQYRRINHIPDDWGTAVNVQQMVFGNRGAGSATGVAFSRDEMTGAPEPSGDFLLDAQGEDVVSGVRTPRPLHELADELPDAHARLLRILRTLEAHYGDMQDTEFTIERGRLYMLQTRSAKRPAQAAVRFAVDAVDEGLLTREQALRHDRRRRARRAAAPDVRPRGALRGARPRRRRVTRRGQGRGRVHRRGGGRRRGAGRAT